MQITEIFYSIQGEGINIGLPTVFIRTTGCNLRCNYCDTTYAYGGGKEMSKTQILLEIKKYRCNHICITGGEPLLQKDLEELIDSLVEEKYVISIETNGSRQLRSFAEKKKLMISMDLKTPSSQMQDQMILENLYVLRKQDQLKCIIKHDEDYEFAKDILKKYQPKCTIIFQPVWGTNPSDLASWILKDQLSVRFGVQLHKMLWGENVHC